MVLRNSWKLSLLILLLSTEVRMVASVWPASPMHQVVWAPARRAKVMTRFGKPIVFGNHDGFSMVFPCSSMSFPIECLSYPYIYIISKFFAHDGYYQYITHIPQVLFLISGLLFNLWDMIFSSGMSRWPTAVSGSLGCGDLVACEIRPFHWSHLLVPTFAEWVSGGHHKKTRKTSVENNTSIVVTQMDRKLENRWKPINGYCNYHLWRPGKTFRHIFSTSSKVSGFSGGEEITDHRVLLEGSLGFRDPSGGSLGHPGSISELSLLNLYSSTVLHLFLCAFFSIFFSSQRRRGVWKVRKPSTCWSPMTNFNTTAA